MAVNKNILCKVTFPDEAVRNYNSFTRKSLGRELYNEIVKQLDLNEPEYFGLEFRNKEKLQVWLDKDKPIWQQVGHVSCEFWFKVKFYIPDPSILEDSQTRYFYSLQIKRDLCSGALLCTASTAALLAAHIVQSELGDFDKSHTDPSYLRDIHLLHQQSADDEMKVMEYHKTLTGMTPEDAEFKILEISKNLESYGVNLVSCEKGDDKRMVSLAVNHSGIHVYLPSSVNCIKSYEWSKIRKLGFKRKLFLIKLYPNIKENKIHSIISFVFASRDAAKHFWKLTVEYHTFFVKESSVPMKKQKSTLLTRGSSFRYCGRTQQELVNSMKGRWGQSTFDRSLSLRSFQTNGNKVFKRSNTFNTGPELGVMTLDRRGHLVTSESKNTIDSSRFSGTYDTGDQLHKSVSSNQFPTSQSLTTISGLVKPSSLYDLKSHSKSNVNILTKDLTRNQNRDSVAQFEDNRVELEMLMEQINLDLKSAKQAAAAQSPIDEEKQRAYIEMFLSGKHSSKTNTTQNTKAESHQGNIKKDDDDMEMILTAEIKDSPVTDLDIEVSDVVSEKAHRSSGFFIIGSQKDDKNVEENTTPISINRTVIDNPPNSTCNQVASKHIPQNSGNDSNMPVILEEVTLTHTDVIVLSSPDNEEDMVFKSGMELSIPVKPAKVRSLQQQMSSLEDISQLAEQVLESQRSHNTSQDLSVITGNVLDLNSENSLARKDTRLSDLSELLYKYDSLERSQHMKMNTKDKSRVKGQLEAISNVAAAIFDVNTELNSKNDSMQNGSPFDITNILRETKCSRKPLIRPSLPILHSPKDVVDSHHSPGLSEHLDISYNAKLANHINNNRQSEGYSSQSSNSSEHEA